MRILSTDDGNAVIEITTARLTGTPVANCRCCDYTCVYWEDDAELSGHTCHED